ncbi:indolepyruvate oxidoreductase subunit beta family protein [Ruixingdingia sedimenti]|uniref:Indolepyruvate oxidoreductase subunit beta family protein n=1 Tax=Ruixingdingia sedimenti TaxID=3073604 RepID=A0ABU1FA99_9RHOB|nr:indolepyruvate oxidoreductase subunit beta family protein [Xinfangfangia sp. LG-4]MDR5653823.1 indolepyruvate oxidoreductase subunit beta family protein [Xinfangfangia sp. LG-4]
MTDQTPILTPRARDPRVDGILKLAVMAVGGQGGGVLTGWIEQLARANGYVAQATSVAGVAQRTGATIYYVEMAPATGRQPVFSLAPAGGDVDVLIAAEMMEAGRAIIRGFVTPDRTTLIASTHRALAVSEKMAPGDGIASSEEVRAAAGIAAQRLVMADFEGAAVKAGSVISASLFGALAGSGALPFPRAAFEAAIRASGKGVEPSLRAFDAGFAAAEAGGAETAPPVPPGAPAAAAPRGPDGLQYEWQRLTDRVADLPAPVAELAAPGLRKVVDFQDTAYGAEYLDRLARVLALDDPAQDYALAREAAKYIANAMAYDDVIRVADLKTRAARMARVRREMGVAGDTVMQITEFMHPRAEEIVGLFPARLGAWVEARPGLMAWIDRRVNKGRRLRSDSLRAFAQLYVLGGLRGWRRISRRHALEQAHLDRWLALAEGYRARNYDLAVEVIRCRRLIKGYSDTHARGLSKFDRVTAAVALLADRPDAADWTRRLREAALQDEAGKALDGAIQTIRSFV